MGRPKRNISRLRPFVPAGSKILDRDNLHVRTYPMPKRRWSLYGMLSRERGARKSYFAAVRNPAFFDIKTGLAMTPTIFIL
jgi:hypothetical protein